MLPMLLLSVATASANTDATDELRAWRDDAAACRYMSAGLQKAYDKCIKRMAKNDKKTLKSKNSLIESGQVLAIADVDERLADIAPKGKNPMATPQYHVSHIDCGAGDRTEGVDVDWETRALDALATARKLDGAAQLTAYLLDRNDQKKAPEAKHVAVLKEVFASVDVDKLKSDIKDIQGSKPTQFSAPTLPLCLMPLSGYILLDFPFADDADSAQKELLATFPE